MAICKAQLYSSTELDAGTFWKPNVTVLTGLCFKTTSFPKQQGLSQIKKLIFRL